MKDIVFLQIRSCAMKKLIITLVILIAGGVSAEVKALRNIDFGEPYQPFCAKQLTGAEICSSQFKNNVLVASFVKMGQKKSLKVLLNLQELYTQHSSKKVSIIGIVSGDVDLQQLKDFTETNNITLPLLLDKKREIYGSFGVFVYPTIAVFDQDRKMQYVLGSTTINIKRRVEGIIRFLLAEIGASELEKILHPVVEEIDHNRAELERNYDFAKNSYAKGQYAIARKIVEASLKKHPDHALSYSLYGYILIEEKEYKLGLQQFERALELDPDLEEAQVGKQTCLDKIKN